MREGRGRREAAAFAPRLDMARERAGDHIKRRANGARAQREDGKDCKVANRVLDSMDLAIEERIENGIGRAGAKIVPCEI